MKNKYLFLGVAAILALSGCVDNSSSSTSAPTSATTSVAPQVSYIERDAISNLGVNSHGLANDVQDGVILHAWNWSYKTIKENLRAIANAGYSTIQTSPVQQSKSTSTTGSWSSSWAMLYQPVSFSIAETSWLGTKAELMDLCAAAEEYGIKIICDIVVNHMANDNTGKGYSERIGEYEPKIYGDLETYFHQNNGSTNDNSIKAVTQGSLSSLPDLNTANTYIQSRVISLLKECVDCGVDGFRFDAAKHIETDEDGEYASLFWQNVLGAATEYAKTTYNNSLYYYGEILNTPGSNRSYDSYTKYMSVTDNRASSNYLSSASSPNGLKSALNYYFSEDGKDAVLWVESHDTFADGSTKSISVDKINKAWAIEASRSGSTALYFARPEANTAMGDVGTTYWKNPEVKAVNKFHNKFMNTKEAISIQTGGNFLNERYDETNNLYGAVLVQTLGSLNVNLQVKHLPDGKYYDQISGNEFNVENGVLKGDKNSLGIYVITSDVPIIEPTISVSSRTGYFYDTYKVNVSANNAPDGIDVSINGELNESSSSKVEVTLGNDSSSEYVVTITAKSGDVEVSETYKYYKIEKKAGYVACAGLKDPTGCEIYAWVWKTGEEGHWERVIIEGNVAYVKVEGGYDNYLLASFPIGYGFENLNSNSWNSKIGQTSDYKVNEDKIENSTI